MAEYIEREQALDVINLADFVADEHGLLLYADSVQSCLLDIPAADVRPVVRGKWLLVNNEFIDEVKCSNCGVVEYFEKGWKYYNFCPNCGADMKGESDG